MGTGQVDGAAVETREALRVPSLARRLVYLLDGCAPVTFGIVGGIAGYVFVWGRNADGDWVSFLAFLVGYVALHSTVVRRLARDGVVELPPYAVSPDVSPPRERSGARPRA